MSNQLAVKDQSNLALRDEPITILEVIAEAAKNPAVDVAKMSALLDMQERIMDKQAEIDFNQAFSAASRRLPRVAKNGTINLGVGKGSIPFVRYEDLDSALRPIEAEFGFTRSFSSEPCASGVLMVVKLAHKGGHSEKSTMQLPADPGPGRNGLQAMGSSRSYGKRYLTMDIWNIVSEGADDDGKAVGYIDDRQMNQICDLIAACELNPARTSKFLEVVGAKQVSEIQKRDYEKAMTMLQAELRKREGR